MLYGGNSTTKSRLHYFHDSFLSFYLGLFNVLIIMNKLCKQLPLNPSNKHPGKLKINSEDQGIGGRMGSEWILGRLAAEVWIEFEWLRIWTGGRLL
jgi:hypothetical protein